MKTKEEFRIQKSVASRKEFFILDSGFWILTPGF